MDGPRERPGVAWSTRVGRFVEGIATTEDRALVTVGASTKSLDVVALGEEGSRLWSTSIDDSESSEHGSPVVKGDTACVAAGTYVVGVDVRDGSERWRYDLGEDTTGSPLLLDETVVVAGENTIVSVGLEDGSPSWAATVADAITSGLAADDEAVFVGTTDSFRPLSRGTGDRRWEYDHDDIEGGLPIVVGDVVYATSWGATHAIDAENGTRVWRKPDENFPITSADDERIYVAGGPNPDNSAGTGVRARNREDGLPYWTTETEPVYTKLSVTPSTIYAGTREGTYAIDPDDGDVLWRVGEYSHGQPVVLENGLLTGISDAVVALRFPD